MSEHLLRLVAEEGERERQLILARATREGEALVQEARDKAEKLLGRTPPPRIRTQGWEALGERRRQVLGLYSERIQQLHAAASDYLARLEPDVRHRLLAQVMLALLEELDAGVYQLEASEAVWRQIVNPETAPPPRPHLRWTPADGYGVRLRGEADSPVVEFSLESMMGQYIDHVAGALALRLLGDELA